MQDLKPLDYCLEYMVTGVHSQIKKADCIICNSEKFINEMQKVAEEQEKFEEIENKEMPNEEDFDDAYDNLAEVADESDEENEEKTKNAVFEMQIKDIETKLGNIQNTFIKTIVETIKEENGIEFLLDNTMGQVINPSNINENRFTVAVRVLSLSLENLNKNQFYNIYCSEQNVFFNKDLVEFSQFGSQKADEFLEQVTLHGKKEGIIETLISRIKNSNSKTSSIIVFTDFTSKNYASYLQQIEEAIKGKEHIPKIHIVSFNLAGVEKKEDKIASYEFYRAIAKLSNGSFTGVVSLSDQIKQELL